MKVVRLFVVNALIRTGAAASGQLFAFFLAERFTDHIGAGARIVGLLGACFFATELLGAPVAGRLADRLGQLRVLRQGPLFGASSGIVGALAAFSASGVVSLVVILLLARAAEGLSAACSVPTTLVLISRASEGDHARRTRWMGLFEVTSLVAMIAGYVVAGVAWDMGRSRAFLALPLIYGVAWLLIGTQREPEANQTHPKGGVLRVVATLAGEPGVVAFGVAWLAVNAVVGVWLQQAPFLFKITERSTTQALVGGFSGREIGLIFGAWGLSFLLGIGLWSWLGARLSRPRSLAIALVGMLGVVASLAVYNHSGARAALVVATLCVVIESGFTPASLAHLADITERHDRTRGAALGLYSLLLGAGQLLGNAIGAPFAARWQMNGVLLVTAALASIALGGVLLMRPNDTSP